MAESYSRIQSRIAQLQRQADKLRRAEVDGVVKKIKVAIEAYGLTAEHLFGAGGKSPRSSPGRRAPAAGDQARYADGAGHVWGGRGPRPKWLRDAIAEGKALDDFRTGPAAATKPAPSRKKRGGSGSNIAIKYRDGENTWTGRGSQPRWLRAALGDGRKLEDFAV